MSFDAYSTTSSNSSRKEIDYDALNKYVVETANLKEPETLVGVIAGIVDLGTQEQPDAENVFKGSEEDEENEINKNPNTYFKDGLDPQTRKPARLKCYPQKPQQSVAIAVDFPEIILDKGEFFGNSNPQPLRMWLGGTFYIEGKGMVVARPTALKVVNIDKEAPKPKWSFSPLHVCHKMAVGAKLIKPGDVFLPQDIDQLIGKSLQFQAQIYMKEVKGKHYFTENIKYIGGLGRGQVSQELDSTFLIQFNKPNKPEDMKQLRNHIVNTIKAANNYQGSAIQKQLEQESVPDVKDESADTGSGSVKVPAKAIEKAQAATKAKPKAKPVDDFEDDDLNLPF
jgi:hypothetical protein